MHLRSRWWSSAAKGVHKLTLTTRHAMTPSMLRKLAQTSSLPNLKSLDLTYHELGAKGALALTDGALFGQLEELGLYNSYIGDAGLDALLSSPAPWQLTALDLRGNELGDAAIARFAASTQVTSLRQLALGSNPVKVNGWRALANSPHLDETIKRPYIEAVARHDSTTSNPHKLN